MNQDRLGKEAAPVYRTGDVEIWARDLEDGSKAAGLFNRGEREAVVTASWSDLGIGGKRIVRDLWRKNHIGEFHASVGEHGIELISLRTER